MKTLMTGWLRGVEHSGRIGNARNFPMFAGKIK